jgi:hypothetical protein
MSTCIPAARVGTHFTRLLSGNPSPLTLTPARRAARTRATRPARLTVERARAGAAKEPGLTRRAPR